MAHQQQIDFCKSVKQELPAFFFNRFVLDVGSLDVNGNNQYLFEDCLYLGVDLLPGKNVDLISQAHRLGLPDESCDVIISTECFEHDQFYAFTLQNIVRILKPGGLFIFTCGTTGRPEHGTRRTTPLDAPFTSEFGEWGDYYKNLEESDIRRALAIDALFERYSFTSNSETCDLYFWGVKKGTLVDRNDYSFQIQLPNLRILMIKDAEIDTLQRRVSDLHNLCAEFTTQLNAIRASTSWRITAPLRHVKTKTTVLLTLTQRVLRVITGHR